MSSCPAPVAILALSMRRFSRASWRCESPLVTPNEDPGVRCGLRFPAQACETFSSPEKEKIEMREGFEARALPLTWIMHETRSRRTGITENQRFMGKVI